jgi:hypothetical protein
LGAVGDCPLGGSSADLAGAHRRGRVGGVGGLGGGVVGAAAGQWRESHAAGGQSECLQNLPGRGLLVVETGDCPIGSAGEVKEQIRVDVGADRTHRAVAERVLNNAGVAAALAILPGPIKTVLGVPVVHQLGAERAAWTAGSSSPTRMPMMAITTGSSTRVKHMRME